MHPSASTYLAPAKLNLFLHITGRRADGYHLLQSVFMLIDWYDTLRITPTSDGQIRREDVHSPQAAAVPALPAQDLCVRAAQLLQQSTGCTLGAHIALEKNIPSEAGMGGGSSDAATCLLALNELWGLHLPRSRLMEIGLGLGADVPFFLLGQNAWVEGIGEQVQAITLPPASFLVIKPARGVSTPALFQHPGLQRHAPHAIIEDFAKTPYDFGHNALQAVAQQLNPEVAQALALLQTHGLHGRMTGSGSAVFAPLPPAFAAQDLLQKLPPGWIAKTVFNLQQHPH